MKFLQVDWPVPAHIKSIVTLVPSGIDLSIHNKNRGHDEKELCDLLSLPSKPIWLRQTHGNDVLVIESNRAYNLPDADASIANSGNTVCAVLTADCLPILLCDLQGERIAAIHAGWRGQVAGIIENTIKAMTVPPSNLLVWLGPAISAKVYEVGEDVYEQVMAMSNNLPEKLFFNKLNTGKNKWLMDLSAIAKFKLQQLGVPSSQIFGGNWCTYSDPSLFYSYRRSKTTKRIASLIWFDL